ncbi:LamG-like jellyroll fold domain-containing protein [Ruania rhizosphaerae]|uniref:LamG-like jellyroll fold domain-containing protein n=1 Tax=Ruania rhizosphaerae TaxID=1840413 RepID=UPI0013567BE0|nr:LamG-like jellyroll fold domain-containing protein [Ruania rhizosphaerae]
MSLHRRSPAPGARRRRIAMTAMTAASAMALGAVGAAVSTTAAVAEPGPESTLVVDADQPFREVSHVATGSLYGIADEGVPSDELIAPIKPNTFVQMPPGGRQQPTGDTLDVWETAARHDAGIVVRIVDYYPGWPYQFSWENTEDRKAWEDVIRDVVADVEASGATNIVAYAPWNESDHTWLEENGTFEELWEFSYNVLREELGPDVPIQGPSFSDNITDMRQFLEFAKETDTVPDVLEWHELIRSSKTKDDVESVRAMLEELDLPDLPIDIAEYASPQEVGLPGPLVGYISKFERFGIDRAELAFWNQSGTLGDLLVERGGAPNGAYWLYTWYADMTGDMVTTTPPSNESPLDGAASVNDARDEVRIIAGGNSGPTSIEVNGLDQLALGEDVNVTLEVTPSYGRTTPTAGPITVSETTYTVGEDGSITVPVVMNPMYGYHVVVSEAGQAESLAGTYTLDNVHSGLPLGTDDGGAIQSAAGQGSTWEIRDAGSGLYTVIDTASGLLLGAQPGEIGNGASAVVQEEDGSEEQLWQLVPDGQGNVRLANYATGLTLGVDQMSTEPGAAAVQWTDGSPTSNCTPDGPRQPGQFGTALDMCGTDSYVTLPDGVVDGLDGDWSISTWVKPSALPTWARVFDIGSGSGSSMFLTLNAGSGPRFVITTSGAGGEQRLDYPGQNLPLDEWTQVTVTVSGTTGTLYIDGEAVVTNDQITNSPADLGAANGRNWLGRSQYGSDPAFDGALDDFAIHSRALSSDEVSELAAGQPVEGDVVSYAFDEPDGGTTVTDSSGNGLDATITAGLGAGDTTTATDEETADRFWTLVRDAEPETGELTLLNEVEGAGAELYGAGPFVLDVVCTADGQIVLEESVTLAAGGESSFDALPLGATCVVTQMADGGATVSELEPADGTITVGEEPAVVTLTSTFEVTSLTVTKTVEGEADTEASFAVGLVCTWTADGQEREVDIPGGAVRELHAPDDLMVTFEDLPIGAACELSESETGGADSTSITVATDGDEAVTTEGTSAEVTVLPDGGTSVTVANVFEQSGAGSGDGSGDQPGSVDDLPTTGTTVLWAVVGAVVLMLAGGILLGVRRQQV